MKIRNWIALLAIVISAHSAYSHSRLKSNSTLIPRNNADDVKTGPCGNTTRSFNAKTYAPGATITVGWEETINHPGRFEFYFSESNEKNFTLIKTVPDDKNGTNDLPHQFTTNITFPNTPCDNCTLQMIQIMTDRDPPSNYYSCADVKLVTTATTPGSGNPSTPTNPEDCKKDSTPKK